MKREDQIKECQSSEDRYGIALGLSTIVNQRLGDDEKPQRHGDRCRGQDVSGHFKEEVDREHIAVQGDQPQGRLAAVLYGRT